MLEKVADQMNRMGQQGAPFLFIIDYEMINPLLLPLEDAANEMIFFSARGRRNYTDSKFTNEKLRMNRYPIEYPVYKKAFDEVYRQIQYGNTFLLNLTFRTEIETNWSLREVFEKSSAPYKLLVKDQFVVFSPEPFIRIDHGAISSYPMKGTIDASIPGAAEIILHDEKERAEHATIVDLIRNDLSMVASDVHVSRYRYPEEITTNYSNLIQISSEVCGTLPPDWKSRLGTIVKSLLPAGSICGAPKAATLKIIRDAEGMPRGYYTGIFGIFDGNTLDSAVMIRYIENSRGKLYFRSGGGITYRSDPRKEYNELIDKVYVATH